MTLAGPFIMLCFCLCSRISESLCFDVSKRPVFSPTAGNGGCAHARAAAESISNGFARTGKATAYGRGPAALACCGRPAKRAAPARGSGGAAPDEASCLRAVARTGEQPRLEQGSRSDAAGCAGKSFDCSVEWSSVEKRRGRRAVGALSGRPANKHAHAHGLP